MIALKSLLRQRADWIKIRLTAFRSLLQDGECWRIAPGIFMASIICAGLIVGKLAPIGEHPLSLGIQALGQLGIGTLMIQYAIKILREEKPFRQFVPYLAQLALLLILIAALSYFADPLVQWIADNPGKAVYTMYLITFILIMIKSTPQMADSVHAYIERDIEHFLSSRRAARENLPEGETPDAAHALQPDRRQATQRDIRWTSVHEAGHSLVYAALGVLPDNFGKVIVKEAITIRPQALLFMGSVPGCDEIHLIKSKVFCEWQMLMCLAGKAAEELLESASSLGPIHDLQQWEATARHYLEAGHGEAYFIRNPANGWEAGLNQQAFAALQAKQRQALKHFLEVNRDVLEDLAATLVEQRELDAAALVPFLERVSVPEEFPRPNGEFKRFGSLE